MPPQRVTLTTGGVGGNRKLWGDNHEIVAIEYDFKIASVYKKMYPIDKVIVSDAHTFLLHHYKKFDFIWSSPPCPSHSDIRRMGAMTGQYEPIFPDMKLYEEIIFLKTYFEGLFVVENVKPYYEPLINAVERGRHLFWANFFIPSFDVVDSRVHNDITGASEVYGVSLNGYDLSDKRKVLRNMVDPRLGLHVFNAAQQSVSNKNKSEFVKKLQTNEAKLVQCSLDI